MATNFLWSNYNTAADAITTGMNSLASAAGIDSAAITLTNNDQYALISVVLATLNIASTSAYVSIYLIPQNADGSTYPNYTTGATPAIPAHYLAKNILFNVLNGAQTQSAIIALPFPDPFKLVIVNNLGVAMNASGNKVSYRTLDDSY